MSSDIHTHFDDLLIWLVPVVRFLTASCIPVQFEVNPG